LYDACVKVHLQMQAYYHIPVDSINSTFYTSGDIRNTHISVKLLLFNQATKNQQIIKKNAIGHKIRTLLPLHIFLIIFRSDILFDDL
jgi:hypothetical protein